MRDREKKQREETERWSDREDERKRNRKMD